VLSTPAYDPPAAPFNASATSGDPCALTLGDYNVENMGPRVAHLPVVAGHIVNALHTPDLLFLQEIQDNSGEGDDGTVAANVTLGKLVAAISAAGGAFNYSWAEIDPVDGQDGGVPGGNIRPVYLCARPFRAAHMLTPRRYNPAKLTLVPGTAGGALDATAVTADSTGAPALTFNPGRIAPADAAWNSSRKPLVAHWQTASGERFFTVDVHFASKSGSSPAQGDARPPVNGVVDGRAAQVAVVAVRSLTYLPAAALTRRRTS
jgi:predicted extracellular nuclease